MATTAPSGRVTPIETLQAAFAMRAQAYAHMFDVLRENFGVERAVDLLREATRRMGVKMGAKFADLGPDDLEGLKQRFLAGILEGDVLFQPQVMRCDAERLEIQFHRCPLKEAWQAMGRSDEDVRLLCKAGGAIDGGLFGAAGFTFKGETWTPGREGCCRLIVEPGTTDT